MTESKTHNETNKTNTIILKVGKDQNGVYITNYKTLYEIRPSNSVLYINGKQHPFPSEYEKIISFSKELPVMEFQQAQKIPDYYTSKNLETLSIKEYNNMLENIKTQCCYVDEEGFITSYKSLKDEMAYRSFKET